MYPILSKIIFEELIDFMSKKDSSHINEIKKSK